MAKNEDIIANGIKYNLKDFWFNSTLLNLYIFIESAKGWTYLLFENWEARTAKITIDFTLNNYVFHGKDASVTTL